MTNILPTWHKVQQSDLHGTGVFAACDIPEGTLIFEYIGTRISQEEADAQPSADPDNPFHTFFFSLSSGEIIDGGQDGNDARWINHSCDPNCEAQEDEEGERVYIVALRDIAEDEELLYDYGLVIDEELTDTLKQQYLCLCKAPNCRGTMLALPDDDESESDSDETDDYVDEDYEDDYSDEDYDDDEADYGKRYRDDDWTRDA